MLFKEHLICVHNVAHILLSKNLDLESAVCCINATYKDCRNKTVSVLVDYCTMERVTF